MVNFTAAGMPQPGIVGSAIPHLENGVDAERLVVRHRLTRHEFERRYIAASHIKKAELIEGIVYLASPLRFNSHAQPHGNIIGWLWTGSAFNKVSTSKEKPMHREWSKVKFFPDYGYLYRICWQEICSKCFVCCNLG